MDSDHRAAAREAELRALRAEKEALSQQNRRTWTLLEERTNENHQLAACPVPALAAYAHVVTLLLPACAASALRDGLQHDVDAGSQPWLGKGDCRRMHPARWLWVLPGTVQHAAAGKRLPRKWCLLSI